MAASEAALLKALDMVTVGAVPTIEALSPVRRSHFTRLRGIVSGDNVVGVGISDKIVEGKNTGEATVCFYVRKKLPPSQITGETALPQAISLPGDKAVFTDVKEIGALRLEAVSKKTKPLQSGFSIGHPNITAGTLGAIVKRAGKLFVLSNSHVLADSGLALIGDPIVYPGAMDGGAVPTNLVASLSAFVAFDKTGALVNRMDAAIAEIAADRLGALNLTIHKAATPLGTVKPRRDMVVAKFGRTTGKTTGTVIDVNFRFTLGYPGVGSVGYIDQVLCTRYTDGGDSGSIVVDTVSGKIVGLHFAGADGGSVFNPIRPVMKELGIRFVSAPP